MSNNLHKLDYSNNASLCNYAKSPLLSRKKEKVLTSKQKSDIISIISKTLDSENYNILHSLSDEYVNSVYKILKPFNKILSIRIANTNTKPHKPTEPNLNKTYIRPNRRRSLPQIDEKVKSSPSSSPKNSPELFKRCQTFNGLGLKDKEYNKDIILPILEILINIFVPFYTLTLTLIIDLIFIIFIN